MAYVVGGSAAGAPAAIAVRRDTFPEALEQACAYLKQGIQQVYIQDHAGNRIKGDDLRSLLSRSKISAR